MQLVETLGREYQMRAIAMSGYGMESDIEKTKQAGFDAHLVKPVSTERLKETIDQIMSGN
jgi:CheY-like chemotaxis protein